MFAFGVVATSKAGCGDNTKIEPPPDAVSQPAHDADVDGDVAIYAAAPTPDPGDTLQG